MKSALTTLLIISFIGVAVFGFLSMILGHTHDGGCIASSQLGALCPFGGTLTFIVFHLDALKYFSTAVFAAALLIFLFGIIFSLLPRPLDKDEEDDYVFRVQGEKFKTLPKIRKITRWLSLHINSPDFSAAAA